MAASPADSTLYRDLFGDEETARLFSDASEIRAMLLVEGALARVQGDIGMIPRDAAAFIERAAREVQIDPTAMAAETGRNGVPVPALLAAFRKATGAAEPMQYLHWGATSQDIMDTALALRLKRLLEIWEARLAALISALGAMADIHADLPMAARTYGQLATPTSFGAWLPVEGGRCCGIGQGWQAFVRKSKQFRCPARPARCLRWASTDRRCGRDWRRRLVCLTLRQAGMRNAISWRLLRRGWQGSAGALAR